LNGHGVRVSDGSNHEIELSKEQLKKFMKAREKGKAITLTMDPFQMQNHQFLRGSGGGSSGSGVGRRNKYTKWVDALGAKQVIDAGMSKGASTISGMGVGRRNKFNKWVDTLGARQVIDAGMSKGASTISGMGFRFSSGQARDMSDLSKKYGKYVPPMDTSGVEIDSNGNMVNTGSGVGRRNKYTKWVDALGAKQVIDAGMSKGASTISGMGVSRRNKYTKWVDALGAKQVIDAGMSKGASTISGFGLKKRKPKKSMKGSALMPAGY
jgi:hypothetical protein